MGEYFPGEIQIGGKLKAELLDEFLQVVRDSGALDEEYDEPFTATSAEELDGFMNGDGHLSLADPEARYGHFEEIEEFCQAHELSYNQHNDPKYEYDSENVYWRLGMEGPLTVCSNNNGVDLVDVNKIRPVVEELAGLVGTEYHRDQLRLAIHDAYQKLNAALPPKVEPLPPLEIVE